MSQKYISLQGGYVHNLKNISVTVPKSVFTVVTGISGSGKSSLVFNILGAEGQRRYTEKLPLETRKSLDIARPDYTIMTGICPTIMVNQQELRGDEKSTVGTITGIHEYLCILYAHIAVPHVPDPKIASPRFEATQICKKFLGKRIFILSPIPSFFQSSRMQKDLRRAGFQKVYINDVFYEWEEISTQPEGLKKSPAVVVDRCTVHMNLLERLQDSLDIARQWNESIVEIYDCETSQTTEFSFSSALERMEKDTHFPPCLFSFNSSKGACPRCAGWGKYRFFSEHLIVPDPQQSLLEGAIKPWRRWGQMGLRRILRGLAKKEVLSLTTPFRDLSPRIQTLILHGEQGVFLGVIPDLEQRLKKADSFQMREELKSYQEEQKCPVCQGMRLRQEALQFQVSGKSIAEIHHYSISEIRPFLISLTFTEEQQKVTYPLLDAIFQRIQLLEEMGLGYLPLNQAAQTLSKGEYQRIHLVPYLSSELCGVLYTLEEPSVGLHPQDQERLLKVLKRLCSTGNTVIVIEHDEEMIRAADYIIDLGPKAGKEGGRVIYTGPGKGLLRCSESLTGRYLNNKERKALQRRDFTNHPFLSINNISYGNLKQVDLSIPLGGLIGISGVSGSGKSTLIFEGVLPQLRKEIKSKQFHCIKGDQNLDRVVIVNHEQLEKTANSNILITLGIFGLIREFFASLPEAKAQGYTARHFSFNRREGRCPFCQGEGTKRVEMPFPPDISMFCERCQGRRYKTEILTITFKDKSIADILNMSLSEAIAFFQNFSSIRKKLTVLEHLGLGYIPIGQTLDTLSTGERQRLKLAKALLRHSNGKTLYVLDEPTIGLHFEDVQKLLIALQALVDEGNTVIVIEHNLDVLKAVDWIIDLGPEGGENGGRIIAQGPPEDIIKVPQSLTGQYLAPLLSLPPSLL
ncbi:MAG: excinuclease ABC subunit UvrA [Holosporales bacterium]|nr:excinuclease ABC subunit UvrA [Holosporales bacterium]